MGLGVDLQQLPPGQRRQHRQERAGGDERPADADRVDQNRRQHRAEPDRADEDHLEHAEDATDHVRRRGPLEQRQPGDVDERVAEAEHAERDERNPGLRPDADRSQGRAPEQDPDPEVRGETLAADQRERRQRADDPADPGSRVQEADAGVSPLQQVERGDDDEHAERTGDHGLGAEYRAIDDAQPPFDRDRLEACGRVAQERAPGVLLAASVSRPPRARPGSGRRAARSRRTFPP